MTEPGPRPTSIAGSAGPTEGPRPGGPWGRGRGPGQRAGFGFIGCLVLALVVFVGLVTVLATWVAGVLLGVISPGASPPTATAVAVIVVLVLAVLVGIRVFGAGGATARGDRLRLRASRRR